MYQTRNKSISWDDNENSLRGLEEYVTVTNSNGCEATTLLNTTSISNSKTSSSSSRRTTRKELIQAVLNEQARLVDTKEGRNEVQQACKVAGLTPEDLIRELLRGVSYPLSKCDKHRAIQIAQKDEKEVHAYNPKCKDQWMSTNHYYSQLTSIVNQFTPNGRRRYLSMIKNKVNDWSNTSSKSISSTGTCGDRSTTSSTCGNHHQEQHLPQSHPHIPTGTRDAVGGGRYLPTGCIRNHLSKNNSIDDSITTDNHEDTDDNNEDEDDDDDDNNNHKKNDGNGVVRPPPNQQQHVRYKDTSPLKIIQQIVYETSKECENDHFCNK